MPVKTGSKAKYKHIRLESPSKFDPRSFRVIPIGKEGKKLIVGCPKGYWDAKKGECKVGTRAQAKLEPKQNPKRRNIMPKKRKYKKNVELGFYDEKGKFHPIRYSADFSPKRAGEKIKMTPARQKHYERKRKEYLEGWEGIKGNIPIYLVENEPPIVKIYDKVDQIKATKEKGEYKGKYYHNFKKKAKIYGINSGPLKGSLLITEKKLK